MADITSANCNLICWKEAIYCPSGLWALMSHISSLKEG